MIENGVRGCRERGYCRRLGTFDIGWRVGMFDSIERGGTFDNSGPGRAKCQIVPPYGIFEDLKTFSLSSVEVVEELGDAGVCQRLRVVVVRRENWTRGRRRRDALWWHVRVHDVV